MVHNGNKWKLKIEKDTWIEMMESTSFNKMNKKLPVEIVDKFNEIKTGYDRKGKYY